MNNCSNLSGKMCSIIRGMCQLRDDIEKYGTNQLKFLEKKNYGMCFQSQLHGKIKMVITHSGA